MDVIHFCAPLPPREVPSGDPGNGWAANQWVMKETGRGIVELMKEARTAAAEKRWETAGARLEAAVVMAYALVDGWEEYGRNFKKWVPRPAVVAEIEYTQKMVEWCQLVGKNLAMLSVWADREQPELVDGLDKRLPSFEATVEYWQECYKSRQEHPVGHPDGWPPGGLWEHHPQTLRVLEELEKQAGDR